MEGAEMEPQHAKKLITLIEADFKSGFSSAMHLLGKDAEKFAMLKVILDQHFNAEEVNLEEVGRAVGISLGYL